MPGFISLCFLISVHLFANRSNVLGWIWGGRFLSIASGLSFAYVFVGLLPALEKGTYALKRSLPSDIPYLDKHVYIIALLGILFYYGIHVYEKGAKRSWLTLSGYLFFNFFIGSSLADSTNPEIQPIALFTIAIGMHYFVRDHSSGVYARKKALGALILSLVMGYVLGRVTHIPDAVGALTMAFVAGGVILNIFHYDLPKKIQGGYLWFVLGALGYTALLLSVGELKL